MAPVSVFSGRTAGPVWFSKLVDDKIKERNMVETPRKDRNQDHLQTIDLYALEKNEGAHIFMSPACGSAPRRGRIRDANDLGGRGRGYRRRIHVEGALSWRLYVRIHGEEEQGVEGLIWLLGMFGPN